MGTDELARSARNRLAAIAPEMQKLAGELELLARASDIQGLTRPGYTLRHMQREIRLILQQADPMIGAVLSASKKGA